MGKKTWQRVWIWERSLKTGVRYYVCWIDEGGRQRCRSAGTDRKRARRLQAEYEVKLNNGQLDEPEEIPFTQFKEEEIEILRGRKAPATIRETERALRQLHELFEPEMLQDVTPKMVETYLSLRLREVRKATANKGLRHLKASLSRAVERGYLEKNPASRVKQVREPDRQIRVLTVEEVKELFAACTSWRWKAMVSLAVTTGMRVGEMTSLTWDDVDFENKVVSITSKPNNPTKSRRNRKVGLNPEVCHILRRLPRNGEYVLHTRDGGKLGNNIQRDFRRIVEKAGIEYCTLHDLRRTFVSHLVMSGANAGIVQKLAGHSSIQTTLSYYTDIFPDALRAAQQKLPFGNVLGGTTDVQQMQKQTDEEK